ncbi:ABC transporter permease [Amycolatopsis sp. CB00013]|uniref:ABC transporter permease n=1 Tax=Amycolatopsis sp. CB00013 TaxID=1703945 RepID=UPI00093EF126|nr:ABC transporter permease [Amycolatopsis sp. CB00013]OKK01327.1 multidrug ABC transporter permease [Amycolatopsis sp. CB00013]
MHAAFVVAAKDLRQRLRDRSAWVLGFLAPVAVALLMSFAFQGGEHFHTKVAVVDQDGGALATAFTALLSGPKLDSVLDVVPVPGEAEARALIDEGGLGAVFLIPPGFTAAAHGGPAEPMTVLSGVDSPLAGTVARSIGESFVAQLNADRLSMATALAAGAGPVDPSETAGLRLPGQVVPKAAGTGRLTAAGYYGPAMGIFFMFFAIGFGARGYFEERANGTLDRISVAPVGAGALLLGKALATFVYGVASLSSVALITGLVLGPGWGPPVAVGMVIVALALTLVCLTAFVIAVAGSDRQAEGIASLVIFGLVLLGGNFIMLGGAPEIMRKLALLTPNGWALRAFTDLAGGAGWISVVQPVLAILLFCVVISAITVPIYRKRFR